MHLAGMAVGSFAVGRTANPGRGLGFRALSDCSFAVMATGYHHLQAFPLVLLLSGATKHRRQSRFPERRWNSQIRAARRPPDRAGAALAADKRCFVLMHV